VTKVHPSPHPLPRLLAQVKREKAVPGVVGSVGAPMPGVVFDVKAKAGDQVEAGVPIVVLSAMKMETVVSATVAGRIAELPVKVGDDVAAGDLLFKIE